MHVTWQSPTSNFFLCSLFKKKRDLMSPVTFLLQQLYIKSGIYLSILSWRESIIINWMHASFKFILGVKLVQTFKTKDKYSNENHSFN